MLKYIFACLLLGCISVQAHAQSNQSQAKIDPEMQKRVSAAVDYYNTVPMENALMQMAAELLGTSRFEDNPELLNQLMASFDMEKVRAAAIRRLAYHFTMDEIIAMRDFYSSPEGQSIYQKSPAYLADLAPVVRSEAIKAGRKVMQDAIMPQGQNK